MKKSGNFPPKPKKEPISKKLFKLLEKFQTILSKKYAFGKISLKFMEFMELSEIQGKVKKNFCLLCLKKKYS